MSISGVEGCRVELVLADIWSVEAFLASVLSVGEAMAEAMSCVNGSGRKRDRFDGFLFAL